MKALACIGMGQAEIGVLDGFRSAGLRMDEIRLEELTEEKIKDGEYLFVFTVNFSPDVSVMCQNLLKPYFSYITGWPVLDVYDPAVKNPCNFIFCFDKAVYEELDRIIPGRSYHLPLGADVGKSPDLEMEEKDKMDVSFIGRLYTEKKAYDKMEGLSEYLQGYLEALLKVQVRIYGYNLLEASLTEEIIKEWKKCVPYEELPDRAIGTDKKVLVSTCFADKVSEMERKQLLKAVSERFKTHIYTKDEVKDLPDVHVHSLAESNEERQEIYRNSRINLHFTHRAITTGVPQEVYDIMAAGGFVLTNYQPELPELFVIGEHLETFVSEEELLEKIEYYLEHEEERIEIAKAGQQAVKEYHSYQARAVAMFNTVFSDAE